MRIEKDVSSSCISSALSSLFFNSDTLSLTSSTLSEDESSAQEKNISFVKRPSFFTSFFSAIR